MIEKVKEVTIFTIRNEWAKEGKIDIVSSTAHLYMRITLACLFGKFDKELKLKQIKDGKEILEPFGIALQKIIE
jgi:hypothetical protein